MLISIVIKEGIIINTNELTEYLSDNSNVLICSVKILAHLQQMNEQRQPAKRYNEAQLRRKTEKHLKEFIENLESQLKRTIPDEYDRPEDWIRF